MAFFSIITPTLNRRTLLERVWNALLGQTYGSWEWCVVNDGSTDDTSAWLESLQDERVKVAHFAQSRGVAAARNQGLSMATAPWLTFLDDDDDWEPHHLESLHQMMEKNEFHHAIYKTGLILDQNGTRHFLPNEPIPGCEKFQYLVQHPFGVSYAFPNKGAGMPTFVPGLEIGEDELFLLKLFQQLDVIAGGTHTVYYHYLPQKKRNVKVTDFSQIIAHIRLFEMETLNISAGPCSHFKRGAYLQSICFSFTSRYLHVLSCYQRLKLLWKAWGFAPHWRKLPAVLRLLLK